MPKLTGIGVQRTARSVQKDKERMQTANSSEFVEKNYGQAALETGEQETRNIES